MSNELSSTLTFQQKMFERIRDQIGDLMTDEDLRKLVEAAMKKAFFEKRIVNDNYGRSSEAPPLFLALIQNQLMERVDQAICKWLQEHPEEVKKAIDDVIAKGMFDSLVRYLDDRMKVPLMELASNLKSNL